MSTQTQQNVKNKLTNRSNGVGQNGNGKGKRTVATVLQEMKPKLEQALPRHMDADRLTRIALTEMRQNPDLLKCEPKSLFGAIMQSAQLGLEPGLLGQCYLIPFNNKRKQPNGSWQKVKEVQFMIGYKGLIDLVRRSGDVKSIQAKEVYENDHFEFEYGLDEKLVHRPEMNQKERGELHCFYAYAKFNDGGHAFTVMSVDEVNAIRDEHSAGYKFQSKTSPWTTNYESMAKKTVIRQLVKYLPMSVELQRNIAVDETVKSDLDADPEFIDVEAEDVPVDEESTQGTKDEDGVGDESKDKEAESNDQVTFSDNKSQNEK